MPDHALPQSGIILYQTEDGRTRIQCRFENDTTRPTLALIDLFQIGVNIVTHHLKEIYEAGELDRTAPIRQIRIVRFEGSREVARDLEHYSLSVMPPRQDGAGTHRRTGKLRRA